MAQQVPEELKTSVLSSVARFFRSAVTTSHRLTELERRAGSCESTVQTLAIEVAKLTERSKHIKELLPTLVNAEVLAATTDLTARVRILEQKNP